MALDSHACEACGVTFPSQEELDSHNEAVHSEDMETAVLLAWSS